MTTATAEPALVSQPDTKVLFMARRSDLRLTKVPRYPIHGPGGQKVGESQGETIAFADGVFRCPTEGPVTLEDGREVDAAEILAWLETHRLNGSLEEGFWRVDPTAPAPSREELDALMKAAIELDKDKLEALIAQERDGWGREDIISTAEKALERIREVHKQAEAAAAAQAAQGGSGGASGATT